MHLVCLGSENTFVLTLPKIAQIQPTLQLTYIHNCTFIYSFIQSVSQSVSRSVRQPWQSAYLISSVPDQRTHAEN